MTKDRDGELEREIRTHLDLEAEERIANGMPEREARDAARRAFGNVTRTREDARAVWTRRWLDETVQDVRYAWRTLRKSPGFTSIAVLTIALGIGANTAMFSVVNAAILRPLGYPQPEQLRMLSTGSGDGKPGPVSPAEYFELTEISQSFSVVGAFVTGEVNLAALDRPRRASRARVNAELLEALAVPPERGRWFRRDETRGGGPAVVILSHELWRTAFGGREDVVGQSIDVDGIRHRGDRRHAVRVRPHGQARRAVAPAPACARDPPVPRESFPVGAGPLEGRCDFATRGGGAGVAHEELECARARERTPVRARRARPADDPGAGRGGRVVAPCLLGAAGGRRPGAAHRVRESRQPADGPRRSSWPRDRRADRPRCRPAAAARAVRRRRARAPRAGRRPWPYRRVGRRRRVDGRLSGERAPRRGHRHRSGGARLYAARVSRHRGGLRPGAAAISVRAHRSVS